MYQALYKTYLVYISPYLILKLLFLFWKLETEAQEGQVTCSLQPRFEHLQMYDFKILSSFYTAYHKQ